VYVSFSGRPNPNSPALAGVTLSFYRWPPPQNCAAAVQTACNSSSALPELPLYAHPAHSPLVIAPHRLNRSNKIIVNKTPLLAQQAPTRSVPRNTLPCSTPGNSRLQWPLLPFRIFQRRHPRQPVQSHPSSLVLFPVFLFFQLSLRGPRLVSLSAILFAPAYSIAYKLPRDRFTSFPFRSMVTSTRSATLMNGIHWLHPRMACGRGHRPGTVGVRESPALNRKSRFPAGSPRMENCHRTPPVSGRLHHFVE